jgi:dTDP-4-dehydrorhamnose reductase
MRLLVTGGGGQVSTDLADVATRAGDEVWAPSRAHLDITDRDMVRAALSTLRPDVVVNCAAWTAVDACESDPDKAHQVNGLAVRWLAEACHDAGTHLVQLSTDYVFDGSKHGPYHEHDEPCPASVYGHAKLTGEREALVLGPAASVVRTSWVSGRVGANMVKTILRLAAEHPTLRFVDDQVGQPTFAADLAPVLRRIALHRVSGVVHATNSSAVSWYQFACEVMAAAGLDPARVSPIATADLHPPRPASRPANSVLDNAVLRAAGWPAMRDFREPLGELVAVLQGS